MSSGYYRHAVRVAALFAALFIASIRLVGDTGSSDGSLLWHGAMLSDDQLADLAAPVLWFSPDEFLLVVAAQPIPARMPCDPIVTNGPVVYYRTTTISRGYDLLGIVARIQEFKRIDYFFYYPQDIGGGCHSNDLESIAVDLSIRPSRSELGAFDVHIDRITGRAHGSYRLDNILNLSGSITASADLSLPMTVLVEENKHATAPDRNADGMLTMGYDINFRVGDAWGIRDIFGSGVVGSPAYQSGMTKPRRPETRVGADSLAVGAFGSKNRSPYGLTMFRYKLRHLPTECKTYKSEATLEPTPYPGCKRRTLESLLRESGIKPSSPLRAIASSAAEFFGDISARYDARDHTKGISMRFAMPDVPLVGGVPGVQALAGSGGIGLGAFYTPSLSRYVEWLSMAGYEWPTDDSGHFVGEIGLQWRTVNMTVGMFGRYRPGRPWSVVVEIGRTPAVRF